MVQVARQAHTYDFTIRFHLNSGGLAVFSLASIEHPPSTILENIAGAPLVQPLMVPEQRALSFGERKDQRLPGHLGHTSTLGNESGE